VVAVDRPRELIEAIAEMVRDGAYQGDRTPFFMRRQPLSCIHSGALAGTLRMASAFQVLAGIIQA
jgi:hypothetical protein